MNYSKCTHVKVEISIENKESDLPAFISCSVVGVVLSDVSVYSVQC